jgi:hypothetical protein
LDSWAFLWEHAQGSTSGNPAWFATSDAQINFTIKGGNALPPDFRVTWKGTLVPADGE